MKKKLNFGEIAAKTRKVIKRQKLKPEVIEEAIQWARKQINKIMQGRDKPPKFLDHAMTIWLTSETSKPYSNNSLVPFGWTVMEIIS